MICNNCNKEIPDGSINCPECGAACNAEEPKNETTVDVNEAVNTQEGTNEAFDAVNKAKNKFTDLLKNNQSFVLVSLNSSYLRL